MEATIKHSQNTYIFNFNSSIDISIPIIPDGIRAFGIPKLKIQAVEQNGWIGDVSKGSAVNFNNISFNPHAHTTHTECVGHISSKKESVNKELTDFFFISKLITVTPKRKNQDCVITKKMISALFLNDDKADALIIRTLPNDAKKKHTNYVNSNPPYLLKDAIDYIVNQGVRHLLIDLPSLDKERDGGKLIGHKSFWRFPQNIRHGATITELIYVSPIVEDGLYLLNLQFAPFENDASPSRPLLFKLHKIDE